MLATFFRAMTLLVLVGILVVLADMTDIMAGDEPADCLAAPEAVHS